MRQLNTKFYSTCIAVLALFLSGCAIFGATRISEPQTGMVASAHPLATAAGLQVLNEGGNAFDAAVTVAAVLAVVEPFGSGLGGGGFWLLHDQHQDRSVFIDGREIAPAAASKKMYLNSAGEVDRDLAINHPLAAAIPGTPAALLHVQQNYGQLPIARLLAPAINYAREGFLVTAEYQNAVRIRLDALQRWPSSAVFLQAGQIPVLGWRLIQDDLANTLEALAEQGRDGFYKGTIAAHLVQAVQENGGIWSLNDLADYEVVEREPIQIKYADYTITSAPLPSSGGLVLASVFGQLQSLDYASHSPSDRVHLWLEANRNAYHQRALTLGDADFTNNSGLELIEPAKLEQLAAKISLTQANKSAALTPVSAGVSGDQTTHFSILDRAGNRAAVTLSINLYFGTGFTATGTGVLLNNEMDDFSALPGAANAYGLVGSEANSIEPGKRPLSSMTPTFLESDQDVWVMGTPGGSRIITMVGWGALAAMAGARPDEVVSMGRIHHQYLPDKVYYEPGALDEAAKLDLEMRGHELSEVSRAYGDMQVIRWQKNNGQVNGASDPRGEGLALSQEQIVDEVKPN